MANISDYISYLTSSLSEVPQEDTRIIQEFVELLKDARIASGQIGSNNSGEGATSPSVTPSQVNQGSVTVATSGTPEQFPEMDVNRQVVLQWHPDNTGRIYIGNSSVGNNLSSPYLDESSPREILEVDNLNELYLNSDNDGDSVLWKCA